MISGKETNMKERFGNLAKHCCECGAKIEDMDRGKGDDYYGTMEKCPQCSINPDKRACLVDTSIQRFLMGNVV